MIGRYAFAVYDEGGLLDMSLAGYPNWSGNPGGSCDPAPTPWLTNVGRKGTVGFADLTGLGSVCAAASSDRQHCRLAQLCNNATDSCELRQFQLSQETTARYRTAMAVICSISAIRHSLLTLTINLCLSQRILSAPFTPTTSNSLARIKRS